MKSDNLDRLQKTTYLRKASIPQLIAINGFAEVAAFLAQESLPLTLDQVCVRRDTSRKHTPLHVKGKQKESGNFKEPRIFS